MNDPTTKREHLLSLALRKGVTDQQDQNDLALREHKLWAKHRVREDPWLGAIEQAVDIPLYTLGKATGALSGRSEPSMSEMSAGFEGMFEGIGENVGDWLSALVGDTPPIAKRQVYDSPTQELGEEGVQRRIRQRTGRPQADTSLSSQLRPQEPTL